LLVLLSDLKPCIATLRLGYQQVLQLFHVDLDHVDGHLEADVRVLIVRNSLKNLVGSHRYNSSISAVPEHRVRLAGPGLPIGKHCYVETLPRLVEHALAEHIPSLCLITVVGSSCRFVVA